LLENSTERDEDAAIDVLRLRVLERHRLAVYLDLDLLSAGYGCRR